MTSKEKNSSHQKHVFLTKPRTGNFHRNEWAILGTPCGKIKKLAFAVTEQLSDKLRVAYVDADHKSADEESEKGRDSNSVLEHGGNLEYTDKITFDRFDLDHKLNEFEAKPQFNSQDLVLINGNHFKAQKQIVVIDPKKSLEKKLDKLTDVGLILLTENDQELPEFLTAHITSTDGTPIEYIPILSIDDNKGVADFLLNSWKDNTPLLKGLVLAGGKSTRMGQDKGKINYHGKEQRLFMLDELMNVCDEAFISVRPDQEEELKEKPTLTDTFMGLGPFGAILSALRNDPNAAWLVVACDQPFLDRSILNQLKEHRNLSKMATCFHNPETNFPEPLITIWEPRSYPILLNFLSLGYSCPRKALINSDCEILQASNDVVLKNANTHEEFVEMTDTLKEQQKKEFLSKLPFSEKIFRELMDYIDQMIGSYERCRHDYRITQLFFEKNNMNFLEFKDFFIEYGGVCDCEILYKMEDLISIDDKQWQ